MFVPSSGTWLTTCRLKTQRTGKPVIYVRAPKIATDFPTLVGGAWAFGVVVVGGVRTSPDPLYPPPSCAPATVLVYVWVCACGCAARHACVYVCVGGCALYVCLCVLCRYRRQGSAVHLGGPLIMLLVEGIGGGYLVGVRACERPCGWWRGRRTQPRASHDVTAADPYPRGGCRRPHHGVHVRSAAAPAVVKFSNVLDVCESCHAYSADVRPPAHRLVFHKRLAPVKFGQLSILL